MEQAQHEQPKRKATPSAQAVVGKPNMFRTAGLLASYPDVVRSRAWPDATRWLTNYGVVVTCHAGPRSGTRLRKALIHSQCYSIHSYLCLLHKG